MQTLGRSDQACSGEACLYARPSPTGSSAHICPAFHDLWYSYSLDSVVLPSWDALLSFPFLVFIVVLKDPHPIKMFGRTPRLSPGEWVPTGLEEGLESIFISGSGDPSGQAGEMIQLLAASWSTRTITYNCTPQCYFHYELFYLYICIYIFYFWLRCVACGILVSLLGIELMPFAVERGVLPLDNQGRPVKLL